MRLSARRERVWTWRRAMAAVAVAVLAAVLLVVAGPQSTALAGVPSGWQVGTAQLRYQGSTVLQTAGDPPATTPDVRLPAGLPIDAKPFFHGNANGQPQPKQLPTPPATPISLTPSGFDGISNLDQRLADGGHQGSGEPPDQALCVGNGFVLEGVNNALRVFAPDGTPLTPTVALGPFFGDGHEVISFPPFVLGPQHSDPRCVFDAATGRFLVSAIQFHRDPTTLADIPPSAVELAVSRTSDPRGAWDVYLLDGTADGAHGSPALQGCPCFSDFPLLGVDTNGVYLTTTEFSFTDEADGGQAGERLFALSKSKLLSGSAHEAVTLTLARTDPTGPFPVHIEPAAVPPGGSYDDSNGGTEYFVASCGSVDGRAYVFALTNTSSLADPTPALTLSDQIIETEPTTGGLPAFTQPDGYRPLAEWIRQQTGAGGLPPLEFGQNSVQCGQVYYADGRLWTTRETSVKPPHGPERAGIAWFQIVPTVHDGQVSGQVVNQGYVTIDGNHVFYSSLAVDRTGHGVIAFGLAGPDYYPSSAYVPIDESGTGAARIVASGTVPLDNYEGYAYFGASSAQARYGDYWIAQEYMPNIPRTLRVNWATHITEIH